jgi:hypothetical protein
MPGTTGIWGVGIGRTVIPFSKRIQIAFTLMRYNNRTDANSIYRFTIGKATGDNAGDLTRAGFGIRWVTNSVIQLQVHNGTTLSNVSTSTTPSNEVSVDVLLDSDGAGNVTLYINGTSVATSTGGPTTDTGGLANGIQIEIENTATPTNQFAAQTLLPRIKVGR